MGTKSYTHFPASIEEQALKRRRKKGKWWEKRKYKTVRRMWREKRKKSVSNIIQKVRKIIKRRKKRRILLSLNNRKTTLESSTPKYQNQLLKLVRNHNKQSQPTLMRSPSMTNAPMPKTPMIPTINDKSPVSMVATDQAGFHVSGWKSEMERHSRVLVLKRPEGVIMYMLGGRNGYSIGKTNLPW